MGVGGARTSETSTTQSWLARCSGGMYDSTHSLTCLIAALRKREGEGRLVSRVSVGRIAVRDREDLRKLDARVPRGERRRGFWARVTHPLLLFGLGLRLVGQLEGTRHDFTRALFHTTHERMATTGEWHGTTRRRKKNVQKCTPLSQSTRKNRHLLYYSLPPRSSRVNPRSSTIPSPSPPP